MKQYLLKPFFLTIVFLYPFLKIFSCENDIWGKVYCDGKAVPGVVVTDGFSCVLTDDNGSYNLNLDKGARFVYLSVPSGYISNNENSIPKFYHRTVNGVKNVYDFCLYRNPKNDLNHSFFVQADVQLTSKDDLNQYETFLRDLLPYMESTSFGQDVFGIDCGDMVGDSPFLFPEYIRTTSVLNMPIYRTIGNHDMTYGGRTFEYSYSTFEDYFGPIYYSFNKGKAHYIVLDNCFYVNRDYQYIGYIDEKTLSWIQKDLSFVSKGSLVFIIMHIPSSSTKILRYNSLLQDETSNASSLYQVLKDYNAHIITGHTHFNLNVCFNDSLMEHNTAAVCGTWWKSDICVDGTPSGYGVYRVIGDSLKWCYKCVGHLDDYQFKIYPVGSADEYPSDIIVNVWNWDEMWKVEWYENGELKGEMKRYIGYDPEAKRVCLDKKKVLYDWIVPAKTGHLFHITPAKGINNIEVRVTDRFGNIYSQFIETK